MQAGAKYSAALIESLDIWASIEIRAGVYLRQTEELLLFH